MAELDQILIINPLKEDFTVTKNGEGYTLHAGETKQQPQYLARHFAKHISDKLCQMEAERIKKSYEKKKEKMPDPEKTRITIYDTPFRRFALYRCLEAKMEVENVIKHYPQFKADDKGKFNFIGEMEDYDDMVAEYHSKKAGVKEKKDDASDEPKVGSGKSQ